MKIPLSITTNYCPTWKAWEGIREIMQNAIDADDDGFKMDVTHRTTKLTIRNQNVVLDTRVLLLGGTMGKGEGARGRHREGMKLALLALVREGCEVTISNGDEVWRPVIEESDLYGGQPVLVINTRKLQNTREDFTVEIENITKEVWTALKKRFLFLAKPSPNEVVETGDGLVLLGDDYKGTVFSRGIYVCTVPNLECGYDLKWLELDRDRKVVNSWDLRYRLAELWNHATVANPDRLAGQVYTMAKKGSEETRALKEHGDVTLAKTLRKELEKEYGAGAVPVASMKEAEQLEGLGATPVLVDSGFKEMIERDGQTLQAILESRRRGVKNRFLPSALTPKEREALVEVSRFTDLANVVVVEFNDETLSGQFDNDTKQLQLSRGALAKDRRELARMVAAQEGLRTGRLIEEVLLDVVYPLTPVPVPSNGVVHSDEEFGSPV